MSKYAKPNHKRIARMLGYALTLGTAAVWHDFTIVLLSRLSEQDRVALAYAALNRLDDNNAYPASEKLEIIRLVEGSHLSGLVTLTFRSLNSFKLPFVQKPSIARQWFVEQTMRGGFLNRPLFAGG